MFHLAASGQRKKRDVASFGRIETVGAEEIGSADRADLRDLNMFKRKPARLELMAADSPEVEMIALAPKRLEGIGQFIAPVDKLSMARAKTRSDASNELCRIGSKLRAHILNSCFVDVQAATLPSVVNGADDSMLWVEEQTGLAVGVLDHKREVW